MLMKDTRLFFLGEWLFFLGDCLFIRLANDLISNNKHQICLWKLFSYELPKDNNKNIHKLMGTIRL